jgi:thiol-disulfide isomerase/thioredoxin
MNRAALSILFLFLACTPLRAQDSNDPIAQALAQGDLYQSRKKFDLALDAYHKADKLCRHSSAPCYLKIASVERKLGDFPAALEDAKRAEKAAGDNKTVAVQAHLFRATLLTQMSGKPSDKKLKEAEDELRQALALDSTTALTHFNLGVVLLKQERDSEGLAEMNTYVSVPSADPATVVEARRIIASPIRARAPFAPDFSFTTHENENLSNAALRGKVVLLDFWGTWCPPCRESVPTVRNLQKKYAGKGFQIVGISSDDDEEVWRTFIKEQQMNWSEYIDLSGTVQEAFKIESFPTYIVLDKDGVVRFRQSGFGEATQGELEEAINKALKRESDPKLAAAALAEAQPASSGSATNARVSAQPASGSAVPRTASPANDAKDDSSLATPSTFSGIEGGVVSGNVYKNQALGMSYEFPRGWIAASASSLHEINERFEAAAKASILQSHPELADRLRPNVAKAIFYASHKGSWDGQHIELPSIRITAAPSRLDELSPDAFQQLATSRATASGMKLIGDPTEFKVNGHQFLRADFERSVGAAHICQSLVQSLAGDYLLTIELFALSTDELQQVAATLKGMSIADEDP